MLFREYVRRFSGRTIGRQFGESHFNWVLQSLCWATLLFAFVSHIALNILFWCSIPFWVTFGVYINLYPRQIIVMITNMAVPLCSPSNALSTLIKSLKHSLTVRSASQSVIPFFMLLFVKYICKVRVDLELRTVSHWDDFGPNYLVKITEKEWAFTE